MELTKLSVNSNKLFAMYQKDDIMTAQIIAKNIFCKAPGDIKLFNSYFSFCTGVITKKPIYSIETFRFFFAEAELALSIFSEKCEMDEKSLKIIKNSHDLLQKKIDIINSMINDLQKKSEMEEVSSNTQIFTELCEKIALLATHYTKKGAEEIASLDEKLNRELLSKSQNRKYTEQSEKLSKIVGNHLIKQNVSYNLQALSSFKEGLQKFIDDSSYRKEKERDRLKSLLTTSMFSYNQEKLFPETLVYYNHVYSFIFNKLDNDGKIFMTECAINNKMQYANQEK